MALRTRRQPPDPELGGPVSSDAADAENTEFGAPTSAGTLSESESEAKFRTVFETMIEACTIFDMVYDDLGKPVDWRVVEANPGYERQSGLKDVAGKLASEFMPGTEPYWIEMFARVVETGQAEEIERWHEPTGRWIHSSTARLGGPGSKRLVSVFYDITARKRAEIELRESEERQAFLLRLTDALRPVGDPEEIKAHAARILGEHLGVNRAFYAEIEGDDWIVVRGYEQAVAPLDDGAHAAERYGPWIMQTYRAGERIVFRDTRTDPRFAESEREAHAAADIIGAVGVPLVKDGVLVAILAAHTAEPREWSDAEIGLVEETAERTWAAVERARAQAALRESEARLGGDLEATQIVQDIANQLISTPGANGHFDRLVEAARALMRADCGSIQTYDEASARLKLVEHVGFHPDSAAFWDWVDAGTGSACGRALALRERVILPDVEAFIAEPPEHEAWHRSGIRSVQSTPLVASTGEVVGMLSTHWHRRNAPAEASYRYFDILARLAADLIVRKRAEAALRQSEEKYRTLFESMAQGYSDIEMIHDADGRPIDHRLIELNPAYERLTGIRVADAEGRTAKEVAPGIEDWWIQTYDRIAHAGEPERIEYELAAFGRWYEAWAYPQGGERLTVLYEDITDRKRAEAALRESEEALRASVARQAFLLSLSDALRQLDDPTEIKAATMRVLAEHLAVNRTEYFEADASEEYLETIGGYADGAPGSVGRFPIVALGQAVASSLRAGRTVVVGDFRADPHIAAAEVRPYETRDFRAFVAAPLIQRGRLVAMLAAVDAAVRQWTPDDVALIEETAERTWAALEQARAEAEVRQALAREHDARREAERALRVRDDFLATVSHELRTPLTAILLWTRVLARNRSAGQDLEAIETIERNAEAQRILIEDLLDASRFMSGTVKLEKRPIDVGALVAEIADGMRPFATERGVALQVGASRPVRARIDIQRFAQSLRVLIDNAVRYSDPGATVTVSLEPVDHEARVTVADTGRGISADVLPHVFERFRRGEDNGGGLGIGLAIAHDIVALHDGTLTAESPGRGHGSTFTIRVPATTGRRRQPNAAGSPRTS